MRSHGSPLERLSRLLRRLVHRSPAHAQCRQLAQQWIDAGRPAIERGESAVAISHWWLTNAERRGERVNSAVRSWQVESEAALERLHPGWLERHLRSRVTCGCGQTWRVESAAFCTHCVAVVVPCCEDRWALPLWRNGNAICPVCNLGEIVG